ncbi:MAG: FlgD immunoglobulin-like domain containing protein, partial [Candidatus Cloacimonetes bacterium]|nr:FlgD immunoglobulin-like domain containing protein [Candidatus Cloacimonadota bacterium]
GYYYLNSINPGSNNLNLNQAAIINAVPANYTISQPRIQILAGNSVAGDPFELKLTTYPVLSSWNVTDYGFTLFYDHTTMEYMGSSLDGTISEGGDLQVLTSEPGYLNVSWNRSEALFGGGDLVKFEFRALEPGDYYFDAVDMAYNSNSLINIDHLITHIPAPVASLAESTISLNNAMQIGYNQVATQNLSTSYLLPSWNVTHYEFDLGYNPEKVQFEAVVSEGTLSEIADNVLATVTSPGTVHVSCDTSVPITGLGSLLLKIQFRAIGNGSTSSATVISISNFMYNDTAILHTSNAYILLSPLTSIDEDFPQAISGLNNYPNPFNPSTTISFSLQRPGEVSLAIYNLKGQKIKTLLEGKMTGGTHQIVWNGKDNAGQAAPSGIYLYRLQADGKNQTGKMVMMK